MNIYIKYTVLFTSLVIISSVLYSQNVKQGIVLNTSLYDLGFVKQDTVISKDFIIRNTSEKDVILKLLSKSCSCTKVKLSNDTIASNQSCSITLTVDTKGKSGYFSIYAIFESNTHQRYHKVSLIGNVSEDRINPKKHSIKM